MLGHFSRGYVGVTPRLQTLTFPTSTGQTANYAYFDNSHDRRLQTLQNLGPSSANISKFDYSYDAEGQILTWAKQFTNQTGVSATLGYDLAEQITSATNTTMGNFSYGYDLGANRTSDELGTHTFNNVNQTQDLGYTYDANGNLTSDGIYNYSWDGLNRLVVIEQIIPGTGGGGSGFAAVKSSPSPSPTPKKLKRRRVLASSHNVPQGATPLGGAGGFPPPTVTYTRSTFAYDGLSRRVRITEQEDTRQSGDTSPPNWVQITDRRYIWSGKTIAEERDASTYAVTRRFFAEGEQINAVNYYFTRDHLGSVRELTSSTGQLAEKYDYDSYGNQQNNDVVGGHGGGMADFGFTGHWFHGPSGLSLSLYRAYDPSLGRWLSRDPIGEKGGTNLYNYVSNSPTSRIDPLGDRWVNVYIWGQSLFFGSPGHVYIGETNNTVILSQNPVPRGLVGGNSTFDWLATRIAEGSSPDYAYRVFIPNDAAFDAAADAERAKPIWSWLPDLNPQNETNCTNAAANALSAGGVPVDPSRLTPEAFNDALQGLLQVEMSQTQAGHPPAWWVIQQR